MGRERGRMGYKVQGIRNIIGEYKVDRGVKNSIGNGEDKEPICMSRGHALSQWRKGRGMLE